MRLRHLELHQAVGFALLLALAGFLLVGVLGAQDTAPLPPPLPCAPLAEYAADVGAIRDRLRLRGGTRGEWIAANEVLSECIAAHGLSRGASPAAP